jgi:hypothetical protein
MASTFVVWCYTSVQLRKFKGSHFYAIKLIIISHFHFKYVAYYRIILTLFYCHTFKLAFLTLSYQLLLPWKWLMGLWRFGFASGIDSDFFSLSPHVGKVTDRIIMEMQLVPPCISLSLHNLALFSKSVCVTKFTNFLLNKILYYSAQKQKWKQNLRKK